MEKLIISEKNENEYLFKVLSLIIGVTFIVFGFKEKGFLKIVLGFLFLFYSTYSRHVYLSKEGLVNTYKGFKLKKSETMKFDDLDEIVIVKQRNTCTMFLIKEPMAKKVAINSQNFKEIIDFIKDNTEVPVTIES